MQPGSSPAGRAGVLKFARRRCLPVAAALAVLAAPPHPAQALQLIDARDGVAIEAVMSMREPTRIRIEGAPITDVFGNIHTNQCAAAPAATTAGIVAPAVNPGGEIVLECDRDKGEIYIRPVGASTDERTKPVNLFISSAQATYTLVLRRSDTPADTIVIRDPTLRQGPPAASSSQGPLGPSANHVRSMKAMLVAMASGRVPPDMRVDDVNQPVQLWTGSRFLLLRRHEGRGLVGETYLLQNIGPAAMVLAEQEFDRPDSGDGAQVVGVSVEHHNLLPGQSTQVFVIRRGARR